MTTTAAGASPVDVSVGRPVPERADIATLKAAADAIGLQYEWHPGCGDALHLTASDATAIFWNSFASSDDALALAVAMEMDVFVRGGRWTEAVAPMGKPYKALHGVHGGALPATRFAITMAATLAPRKTPNVRAEPAPTAKETHEHL